jgi:hypothetical protein
VEIDELQFRVLAARVSALAEELQDLRTRAPDGGAHLSVAASAEPATPIATSDPTAWVDWLRRHYGLEDEVPDCWSEHRSIREELLALRLAHAAAYDDADARPTDPLLWHDALTRVVQRIREWDKQRCRSRGHQGRFASEESEADPPGT